MLALRRVPFRSFRQLHTKPLRPWSSHRLTTPSAPAQKPQESSGQQAPAPATKTEPKSEASAPQPRRRRPLKPLKAAISLTPAAVEHLRMLLDSPEPKLIRIGVNNRGCSGLTYNLEYVEHPGKFDEEVYQDGVKVLIDAKALFSVIGSQMDFVTDKLSSRFVFNNPNSKGSCGCGESFMV